MALTDRLQRLFRRDGSAPNNAGLPRGVVGPWGTIGGGYPLGHGWDHWNRYNGRPGTAFKYRDVDKMTAAQLYQTQPHLQTVVSFRARNLAQLPLHLYRIVEGQHEREHGPLADLFTRPNSFQTGFELMRNLVTTLDLEGRAYWAVFPSSEAKAGWHILQLPTRLVTPVDGTAFQAASYEVESPTGADPLTVPAEHVVEFKTASANGITSAAPVDALREILKEQLAAWEYRANSWSRGVQVGSYVYRPKDAPLWQDAARDRFAEDWHEFQAGGARAGEVPVFEDGMELRRVGFSAREDEWAEIARLSLQTICSIYHVPPSMVGADGTTSYASAREFRSMLYTETLGPIIREIEQRINAFVLPIISPDDDTLAVKFNIDAKLAGSFEEQASVLSTATGAPWMTVNEARALRNLPPLPDGDGLVVPLNVTVGGQASPQDGGEPSVAVQNAIQAQQQEQEDGEEGEVSE